MTNQEITLAIKDALLQRLNDRINQIPDERDREVVALRALHGYNFEQIGELLGMSFEVAEARWHKVTEQWANARG
jgi:DNA-directed RNA polymerase specialized sigma24 family protein